MPPASIWSPLYFVRALQRSTPMTHLIDLAPTCAPNVMLHPSEEYWPKDPS